ncbi:MAG: hypothetical protein HOV80_20435, partial [Polyangiaceae bacterium]|nr:hypothetical protein [Polyangiaceae bacterium]
MSAGSTSRFASSWSRSIARCTSSLTALRELVDKIVADKKIEGVVWEIPGLHTGWGHAAALRDLLRKLRESGKKVVAWLPEGAGNRELYVTSAADRVLTTPHATISPMGLAAARNYVKGLLDRFGVQIEVHRRREFKTAVEPAVSDQMTDAQREQVGALLDTIDQALVKAIAERPGFGGDEAKVRALFDDAMLSAEIAKQQGLVDGLCYEDGLAQAIVGDGAKAPTLVRAPRYFRYHASRFFRAIGPRPFVAIVPVHGAISSGGGGPAIGGPPATHEAVTGAIRAVARDPRALGVVLHVDSPGGS